VAVIEPRTKGIAVEVRKTDPIYTVDEYLEIERRSKERHEYLDGDIYAMAGESGAHGDITTNIVIALGSQLRGTSCRVRSKDTKVRSGPTPIRFRNTEGLYSYPDVVVICGEPVHHDDHHDDHQDVVINATVMIEVLSPSTEEFDRGEKWQRYQIWHPRLRDYLLISQDQPVIEHFRHLESGEWTPAERIAGLDSTVSLVSISCTLKLADVFDRIDFG
jgi:Uma2 family endonuclease